MNQVVVYHFDVTPPVDSTSYGNNPSDSSEITNGSSVIGAGARFGGAQRITIPASPSLRLVPVEGMTLSTWITVDGEQADAVVVQGSDPAGGRLTLARRRTDAVPRDRRAAPAPAGRRRASR